MADVPPLEHVMPGHCSIMERKSYSVMFSEIMKTVDITLGDTFKPTANLVVTGNSGIGKSCFLLYYAYELLRRHKVENNSWSYKLLLHCRNRYMLYCPESDKFVKLANISDIYQLIDEHEVLRLIDSQSSYLVGARGVSILFASPDLIDKEYRYTRSNSFTYIMPVRSLDELQDCNSLLCDELKLSGDVLTSRYKKFGGIARLIFTKSEDESEEDLRRTIFIVHPSPFHLGTCLVLCNY
ncbi:Crinkler (CRN) [Phytophthora megakarya]|uniref:Crinkler (CRN) n=1 Tax=Phytophthora megakarya TaxID=4795 RepID=A0A225WFI9_9STRA|nr:Crinkler (CRN) [Phytophthora megakarya]